MEEHCRVCMTSSSPLSEIFPLDQLESKECSIADIINQCVESKITPEDKLSKNICILCARNARIAFKFKQRFEKSQLLLTLRAVKQEDEDFIESLETEDWELTRNDVKLEQDECPKSKMRSKTQATTCTTSKNKRKIVTKPKPEKKSNKTKKIKNQSRTKNHHCEICGKQFVNKADKNSHHNVHIGVRPYKCKQCSKSYSAPQSLRVHILSHSKGSKIKDRSGNSVTQSAP